MKVRIETTHYFSANYEHKSKYIVITENDEFINLYTRQDVDNYLSYLKAIRDGNSKVEEIEI